jgi:hypothetical protein
MHLMQLLTLPHLLLTHLLTLVLKLAVLRNN